MSRLKEIVTERNACSIPWLHTEIDLQLNQIKPCCKYTGVIAPADQGITNAWRSPAYQALRKDIQNDLLHPACSACAVPDTVFSYKSFKNKDYAHRLHRVDIEQPALPEVFHITLKNTCNLACRMCYPVLSSKLHELSKKSEFLTQLYHINPVNNRFDFDRLRGSFANARHVTISGGEPLIDGDCLQLINMIKEESNKLTTMTFSTNMTLHNKELVEALASMPALVTFNLSLDGPQPIHEYIRTHAQWGDIVDNLKLLNQHPRFQFGINTTLSALNLGYVGATLDAIQELAQTTGTKFKHIMASPVLEKHLHGSVLPSEIRQLYLKRLNNYVPNYEISGQAELINAAKTILTAPQGNSKLFVKFIKEFDKLVNTSYTSVYPEWATI